MHKRWSVHPVVLFVLLLSTYCLFSLDLITIIVEDSVHEKPSSADVKRIVEAVGFVTCVIL